MHGVRSHILLAFVCFAQLAQAVDRISVRNDGSIAAPLHVGDSVEQPVVLKLGLPQVPAAKFWHEGEALRGLWVTNGIIYTQTTLLIRAPSARSNAVLLVNIEGENTNSQYSDARAELVMELNANRQELELKDGLVWRREKETLSLLGALEISESGVKVPRGQILQFAGHMPPSQKGSMTLKIPLRGIDGGAAAEWLKDIEFEAELGRRQKLHTKSEDQTDWSVGFAHEAPACEDHLLSNAETTNSLPGWFPKAPRLPPAQGQVIRVRNVEQLLEAVDALGPGGTILVEEGYYRLPRVLVLDQKQNVAIRGAGSDPAKVTLSGKGWDSGSQNDDILHIAHCEGVVIADLTFADCRSYGVKVEAENAPRDIQIYNCRFRDIGVRALKGSAGTDTSVRAVKGSVRFCSFENTRIPPADWLFGGDYISAIDMMALEDWTFSDNVFRNIRGRNGGGRAAIFIWVRSRKVTVERNLILDCDRGVAFGNPGESTANRPGERLVYVSEGAIQNNMVVGGPDCGIELWHVDQIKVRHNSIWRPDQHRNRGVRIGTGTIRTEILNNLIHGEITIDGGAAQLGNNLSGNLEGYFVQPSSGNLALTARAVGAIDQAEPLAEVPKDIRGRQRVGSPDLGAWEFDGVR